MNQQTRSNIQTIQLLLLLTRERCSQETGGRAQQVDGSPAVCDEGGGEAQGLQHLYLVVLRSARHGQDGLLPHGGHHLLELSCLDLGHLLGLLYLQLVLLQGELDVCLPGGLQSLQLGLRLNLQSLRLQFSRLNCSLRLYFSRLRSRDGLSLSLTSGLHRGTLGLQGEQLPPGLLSLALVQDLLSLQLPLRLLLDPL